MLGQLGTVLGMIVAFANQAPMGHSTVSESFSCINISMTLWPLAAGLFVAILAVSLYILFKNRLFRIILAMAGLTMCLIKPLRNVVVVEE